MKLRFYFLLLAVGIALLAAVALYATFGSHPALFYSTEVFACLLLVCLWYAYTRAIRPYDTIVGGMELLRELDMSTSLAPSSLPEADAIVQIINQLLRSLRSEHLTLTEQNTFLSLLIEASPMGIVQCDLDGHVTSMNPAAHRMMTPAVSDALRGLPLGGQTTLRLTGDAEVYHLSHLSFPDRGYQHPFYLIESLTTEVRRAERAAYERVIRMIAHEVGNSVGGIVVGLESMAPSPVVGSLESRLLAMSDFVTRFADVVKIPQPLLQLCDLSEEVEACRPFLESLCHGTAVRLRFRLTDDAIPVRLDSSLFQQVLINIVKNSMESIASVTPPAPEGAFILVEVAFQAAASPAGDGQTTPLPGPVLTITDNGRGISPEAARHLFTPFFSTKPAGQGLGLLLIRDILTAHGCTFTLLTDRSDHLTRFTIHFP